MAKNKHPRWVEVSKAEAESHPLFGVEGWTAFIGYMIGLSAAIKIVAAIAVVFFDFISVIVFLKLELSAAIDVLFCVLLFRRSHLFYHPYLVWRSIWFLFVLIAFPFQDLSGVGDVVLAILGIIEMAAHVGYLVFSRRVQVTFRHRVMSNELHLVWGQDRAQHFLDTGETISWFETKSFQQFQTGSSRQ